MADVIVSADMRLYQIFKQGDVRDPLGVWASRVTAVGDGTGVGSVQADIGLPQSRRAGQILTCYGVTGAHGAGVLSSTEFGCRLLTNWPSGDSPGVQGFSTNRATLISLIAPTAAGARAAQLSPVLDPQSRFILLFDPRPGVPGRINFIQLWFDQNEGVVNYFFEAWGYWWNRDVLEAPGGPRHPGSV